MQRANIRQCVWAWGGGVDVACGVDVCVGVGVGASHVSHQVSFMLLAKILFILTR